MKKTFSAICTESLSALSPRAQDCVERRFGIGHDTHQTLDAIGKKHDITRERVRQIVRASLSQIHDHASGDYEAAQDAIEAFVRSRGGIVRAPRLFKKFFKDHGADGGVMRFFIAASESVVLVDRHKKHPIEPSIHLKDFDFSRWQSLHKDAHNYFEQTNVVATEDDLYAVLAKKHKYLDSLHIKEHLHASQEIAKNNYGHWGKTDWSEVKPKSIRDKVHLILKHANDPLHFREIAQEIDAKNLGKGKKKTHPQTVHNELIKDKNFVLVGRGTYGLASKGYKKGKVKDLIIEAITKAGKPLTADEVIDIVLSQRTVKPATVKINLHAIAKNDGGVYYLK
jgi:hypothetical protein